MDSVVLSRSSSAPSSVSPVTDSVVMSPTEILSPSPSAPSSVTHVETSLDSTSSLHCPRVDSETMDTDADSEATESDSSSLSLHCPRVETSSSSSSSSTSSSSASSSSSPSHSPSPSPLPAASPSSSPSSLHCPHMETPSSPSSSPSSPSSSDESTLLIPVFPERDTPAPSRPAAVVDGTQCPVEDIEVGDRLGKCCFTRLTCSGHEQRSTHHVVPHGGLPGVLQHAEPGGLGDEEPQRVPARASASAEHRRRLRAVPEDASPPCARVPPLHQDGEDHAANPGYAAPVHGGMATLARRPSSWTKRTPRAGRISSPC